MKFDLNAIENGNSRGSSERMRDIIEASLKYHQYSGPQIAQGLKLKPSAYCPTSTIRQVVEVGAAMNEDIVVHGVTYRIVRVVPQVSLVKNEDEDAA